MKARTLQKVLQQFPWLWAIRNWWCPNLQNVAIGHYEDFRFFSDTLMKSCFDLLERIEVWVHWSEGFGEEPAEGVTRITAPEGYAIDPPKSDDELRQIMTLPKVYIAEQVLDLVPAYQTIEHFALVFIGTNKTRGLIHVIKRKGQDHSFRKMTEELVGELKH
jgi:hypothetical protein